MLAEKSVLVGEGVVSAPGSSNSCLYCQRFPQTGWLDHIELLPLDDAGVVLEYVQHRQNVDTQPNATAGLTLKPVNQSYQFFYWSYVHNMRVAASSPEPDSLPQYFIKAECWADNKVQSEVAVVCHC